MPASAATRNVHLSNYAHGIAQDMQSALADFLAPQVATGTAQGQFKKFNDKNGFQTYDTLRALGGPNRRIEFGATDPFFNCRPNGLAIAIDDHERSKAGVGADRQLEEAKVKTLISTSVLSHEAAVFAKVKADVSAVGGKGVWSDADVDPITELDEQIEAIAIDTGRMPNRMVIGLGAWRILRNHPKVIARQPGATLIGITTSEAARMMLNPGIDIRVGLLGADTKKFGAGRTVQNIVGADIFLFFNEDAPTPYDPGFMKTFTPRVGAVDSVMEFRDEDNNSDVYKTNWEVEMQVVSTLLVRRITLS